MGNILYILIVILIIGWLLGYFAFPGTGGNLIHILLVIAVVLLLFKLIGGRRGI